MDRGHTWAGLTLGIAYSSASVGLGDNICEIYLNLLEEKLIMQPRLRHSSSPFTALVRDSRLTRGWRSHYTQLENRLHNTTWSSTLAGLVLILPNARCCYGITEGKIRVLGTQ